MQFHVAAYACSPNGFTWDFPELETPYYERLKENKLVRGLEYPFIYGLHLYDDEWFLSNIDTQWEFAFTCIPGVMMNTDSYPFSASRSPSGQTMWQTWQWWIGPWRCLTAAWS
jgi:hypothetical protein